MKRFTLTAALLLCLSSSAFAQSTADCLNLSSVWTRVTGTICVVPTPVVQPPPPPPPPPDPIPVPDPVPVPDPTPVPVTGGVYMSTAGLDTNAGTLTAPVKTFAKALTLLKPGGDLTLADGTYTSCLSNPPSGTATAPTKIHANRAQVNCGLTLGDRSTKVSYVVFDGISFDGGTTKPGATVYNTDHVTIRNGGFHSLVNDGGGVFDVGTNDGPTNTNNVFEDIWVWGKARAIADNYSANSNTWRRVVIRGDGCSSAACAGSGNPNIGYTVYNSQHITTENMLILDRVLTGSGNNYADFATAQHNSGTSFFNGDNQWLGNISLNAPDHCFYFEEENRGPDPDVTVKDAFCWKSKEDMSIQPKGSVVLAGITLTWPSVYTEGSSITKSGILVNATPTNHTGGASSLVRYVDRQKTTTALWPWPNEARIKAEMCVGVTRGFCADTSLTHYVWTQMGSGSPY